MTEAKPSRRLALGLAAALFLLMLAGVALLWRPDSWSARPTRPAPTSARPEASALTAPSRPADAAPDRSPASHGEPRPAEDSRPVLAVLDRSTGRGLAGASIVWSRSDGKRGTLETDSDGRARLDQVGRHALAIAATGFAGLLVTPDVGATQVFELSAAGRLVLRFSNDAGKPVPGVRACLLPPLPAGDEWPEYWLSSIAPPSIDWPRRNQLVNPWGALDALLAPTLDEQARRARFAATDFTDLDQARVRWDHRCVPEAANLAVQHPVACTADARGEIDFGLVPAIGGYRWGLLSLIGVRLGPDPHPGFVDEDGQAQWLYPNPEHERSPTSDAFEIPAGDTLVIPVQVDWDPESGPVPQFTLESEKPLASCSSKYSVAGLAHRVVVCVEELPAVRQECHGGARIRITACVPRPTGSAEAGFPPAPGSQPPEHEAWLEASVNVCPDSTQDIVVTLDGLVYTIAIFGWTWGDFAHGRTRSDVLTILASG